MTTETPEAPIDHEASQVSASDATLKHDRYIHSDIFEKLVDDDDDLVGLIAYGLYQQRKREWIAEHLRRNRTSPSENDLKAYAFHFQESSLLALQQEAEGILFRYGEDYVESQLPKLQSFAFNEKTSEEIGALKGMIREISGYKHHIVGHILGFMVLVAAVYFFSLVIKYEPLLDKLPGLRHQETAPQITPKPPQ